MSTDPVRQTPYMKEPLPEKKILKQPHPICKICPHCGYSSNYDPEFSILHNRGPGPPLRCDHNLNKSCEDWDVYLIQICKTCDSVTRVTQFCKTAPTESEAPTESKSLSIKEIPTSFLFGVAGAAVFHLAKMIIGF